MEVKSGKISLEVFKTLFSEERRIRILVSIGILGMLLVLLSQCSFPSRGTASRAENGTVSAEEYT